MASVLFKNTLVLVRGGGDLASGVIYRLYRAGFPVVVSELPIPKLIRRTVSYGEAAFSGSVTVEGITSCLVHNVEDISSILIEGKIPVIHDATRTIIETLNPV